MRPTWTRILPVAALVACGLAAAPARAQVAAMADTADGVIDTEQAWRKVTEARDAAGEDRHHEAVADYLEALANDARLVPMVAQEIAYQKLWREDAEKSIFYFRRYLARHPDEENRDVRKGLAMAYSWSGRQPEAVGLYRELVAEDPTDGAARLGLARSLLWDNRLREGWSVLRAVEDESGPDEAAGREAGDFALVVLDSYSAPLAADLNASWDSDDLDIVRLGVTGSFTVLGNKLLQVTPSYGRYRQPGQAEIGNPALGFGFHAALAHNWALHAYGKVQHFGTGSPLYAGPENLDWTNLAGDFWLTWLPAPRWRIDFGGTSAPVETFFALDNHIHYEQTNASVDHRLGRHWSAGLSANLADYSDGNSRTRGAARITWKREGRWEIHAGPVLTWMDFEIPYPGGYWAPDEVVNGSLEATLKTRTRHWTWRLNGSVGVENETGADQVTVGGVSLRTGWRFAPDWLAAVEGGHSRSSFSSASGFNRTFLNLTVRRFF